MIFHMRRLDLMLSQVPSSSDESHESMSWSLILRLLPMVGAETTVVRNRRRQEEG
jgi:hypothetical protein